MTILTHFLALNLGFLLGWCAVIILSRNSDRCSDCPQETVDLFEAHKEK